MASIAPNLPSPNSGQAYCNVSALEGGLLVFKGKHAVAGVDDNDQHVAPSLAFLLTHVTSGKRLVFDLGICLDEGCKAFTPQMLKVADEYEVRVPRNVFASLKAGGINPDDITHICISHVHADHVGNPAWFDKARFLLGDAAQSLFKPEASYPTVPESIFNADLLPWDRVDFLDVKGSEWKYIGPFDRALDYFGDGSLYIVDAPGHVAGHLNILARTSSDGGWIYLAGDSAHDWRLLRDKADLAVMHDPIHGETCLMHDDLPKAKEHIRKITELMTLPRVRVILAHDNEWYEENKGGSGFLPNTIISL